MTEALDFHSKLKGKIGISSKVEIKTKKDLALAYTPGVAEPCREIAKDKTLVYKYTLKGNSLAVVSDGSAVLGLGNIGAEASLPVMEGKCLIFKQLANIDAFPICVTTQDADEIVNIVKNISPVFGAINLEDIAAPKCFEIEERLKAELDIPVMHDDQHGTAIVVLAGLINALKVTQKKKETARVIINGSGAAGIAVGKMLLKYGFGDVTLCDRAGMIYDGRHEDMNTYKVQMSKYTNLQKRKGNVHEAIVGADIFIGLSAPNLLTADDVKKMNHPIIFGFMMKPAVHLDPTLLFLGQCDIECFFNYFQNLQHVLRVNAEMGKFVLTIDL